MFQVMRESDGWHVKSARLGVMQQMDAFPTRRAAVAKMSLYLRAVAEAKAMDTYVMARRVENDD